MKIAFVLYDGYAALDFGGLFEPLSQLKTLGLAEDLEWDICAVKEEVLNSQGLALKVTKVKQPLEDYDLVALPGGQVTKALQEKELLDWLESARALPWMAASGQGVLLLAAAGLLNGKKVSAKAEIFTELKDYGATPLEDELVEDDAIFTAAASAGALKLGLSLCAQLAGLGAAGKVRSALGSREESLSLPKELISDIPKESGEGLRYALVKRKTNETDIEIELDLDGSGKYEISTGLPFLDHMLTQVAVHGLFDLKVKAVGDIEIDPHHTVEDTGRVFGKTFQKALGNRAGIKRMAARFCAMDDSLARVTLDFSGRPYAIVQTCWKAPSVGNIPVSLFKHFLESFAYEAGCNLHVSVLYGEDDHHMAEAIFKAFARALDEATQPDPRRGGSIPSSKGSLE